jgi:3'-phosphoadenosine 5'-phosphosulfate sulfotransferase (PAPS reductase)/FAD synthetase
MVGSEKRDVWRDSLSAMKASLESSYEFKTVREEARLVDGLRDVKQDYFVFSGYRRNDGKRRIDDIKNLIDSAIERFDYCDSKEASHLYLETLKAVMMQTKWAAILESFVDYQKVKYF